MNTISRNDINEMQCYLGVTFPTSYREFLFTHGNMKSAGFSILGIPKKLGETEKVEPEKTEAEDSWLDFDRIKKSQQCPACGQRKDIGRNVCYPCYLAHSNETRERHIHIAVWIKNKRASLKTSVVKKQRKQEISVVEATEFLRKKRTDLANRKLIPIFFKQDSNTDRQMALCMDLSGETKNDAPLVLITDINQQTEPISHNPETFSAWLFHIQQMEIRHNRFKKARRQIRNRNNEILERELLDALKKNFGRKCPICLAHDREVTIFQETNREKPRLTCRECYDEWKSLTGKKLDFVEWVDKKLENKVKLPTFSEKGIEMIKGRPEKPTLIHPRHQDWCTRIFRVTDYVVGLTAFRYSYKMSCLEVDAFWSGDLAGYVKGQAIRNLAIAILSEASALTGSLALAFTEDVRENPDTGKITRGLGKSLEKLPEKRKAEAEKNYGRISCPVPQELVDLASQHQISLNQSYNGIITHQEGLEIFWAALGWPEHLQAKVDELEEKGYLTKQALASVIYSGIWSLQEAIWLFENSPRPEAVLLGSDAPEDRLYYTESLHWGRSAYLANLLKIKVSADLADGLSVEEREESDCELEPCEGFWILKTVRNFNLPWMIKGSDPVLVKTNEPVLILSMPRQTTKEANDLEVLKSGFKALKDAKSEAKIRCLIVGFEFSDMKYGMKVAEFMKENSKKLAAKGIYLMFSPYRLDLLNDEAENRMASARKKRQFPARKNCLHLQLFAIPEERWQKPDLLYSVEDAKGAAYWIENKVDLRLGRIRFRVNCNCIERVAVQDDQVKLIGEVTGQNSKTLLSAMTSESGIVCPFVLPDEMPGFIKKTNGMLTKSKGKTSGLVAVIVPDHLSAEETIEPSPLTARTNSVGSGFHFKVDPNDIDPKTYVINRPEEIARTHQQIQEALKSGQPLAVSYLRHEIFVETIRDYVFAKSKKDSTGLRVVYSDGTEGCPFPLFCLPGRPPTDELDGLFQMKVGSISMRHVDLDSVTDGYLLQNIMISKRKLSSAEQEDYAFRRTWWFLSNFVDLVQHKGVKKLCQQEIRFRYLWNVLKMKNKKSKGCELHIFQTGLVPATVGIYRAVVKFLQERRGELVVVPRLIGKKAESKEVEATADAAYLPAVAWF